MSETPTPVPIPDTPAPSTMAESPKEKKQKKSKKVGKKTAGESDPNYLLWGLGGAALFFLYLRNRNQAPVQTREALVIVNPPIAADPISPAGSGLVSSDFAVMPDQRVSFGAAYGI